jgi:hypothetical protein
MIIIHSDFFDKSMKYSKLMAYIGSLLLNAGIKSLRATLPAEIFYWGL